MILFALIPAVLLLVAVFAASGPGALSERVDVALGWCVVVLLVVVAVVGIVA